MTQGAEPFFASAFDVRTYARLMGILRLNSFSVQCPLGSSREPPTSPASAHEEGRPHHEPAFSAASAGVRGESPDSSSRGVCGGTSGVGGGALDCSSRAPDEGGGDGCCGGGEDNGSIDALEVRGGTALYVTASYANHDCSPNLDVLMGPHAALRYAARRRVAAGEELTITYLDSSLPVSARRGKLAHGYGFECACALCSEQVVALRAERAAEARRQRQLQNTGARE